MVLNTEWAQVEVIDLINDGSGLAFGIIGGRSTGVVVKTILPGGVADRDGRLQSGDHILQIGEVNLRGLGSEQVASVLRQCGVHAFGSHAPIVPTKILGDPVELDRHLIENGYAEALTQLAPSNYNTPYIYTGQQSDIQLHPISGIVDVCKDPLPIGNVPVAPIQTLVQNIAPKMLPLDMALHEPDLPETETFTVELKKDDLGLGITVAGYVCEKEEISGIFVKSISKGSAADLTKNIKINDRIVEVNGTSVVGFTNHQAVEVLRRTGSVVSIKVERYLRGPKYEQLQMAIRANELRPPSPPSPSVSSLPKVPLSLVQMSYLGIEPEADSRTSMDFDSIILMETDTGGNEEEKEIVIDGNRSLQFSIASHESIYEKWREEFDPSVEIVIAEMQKELAKGLGISLEGTVDVEDGKEVRPHHYIRNILPDGPVGLSGILQSGDELLEVNGILLLGLNHLEVVSILKQLPSVVSLVCARYQVPTRVIDTSQHREAFQARKILAGSLQTLIPVSEASRLVKAKSETSIGSSIPSEACSTSKSRSLELIAGLPMWSSEPTVVELNKGEHGLGFSILDYQDPLNSKDTVIVIRSLVPGGVAQSDGRLIPGDRLMAVNEIDVANASLDRAVQVLKSAPKGLVKISVAKPLNNDAVSYASQDTEDDQTCLEDFQECIEEYQECLEVVHICIDEENSFNHSPCTSQVEELGQNTQRLKNLTNGTFLENNYLNVNKNKDDSDYDISYKSTTNEIVVDNKLISEVNGVKTNNNKCDKLVKTDSLTQSDKISEKDGYETCIDESFSEDNKSFKKTDPFESKTVQILDEVDDITPTNSRHKLDQKISVPENPTLSPAVSEPLLNTDFIEHHLCFDSKYDEDGLKSYDQTEDSNIDEFFLVQYPSDPTKSYSDPNVLDSSSTPRKNCYKKCLKEYYNDYEECLEAYRLQKENTKKELADEDIFHEIVLPFKSRSAPDVMDRSFVMLTYDPGPERCRRKSDFVPGHQIEDIDRNLQQMTVTCQLDNDYGAPKECHVDVMLQKHWGSTHTIKIFREPNRSLGISIVGGKVDLHQSETSTVLGIFVKNVVPNSPAGKTGQFKTGDRILEVSGVDLRQASHETAVEAIRNASNPVIFIIQSIKPWNTASIDHDKNSNKNQEENCPSPHPSPVSLKAPQELPNKVGQPKETQGFLSPTPQNIGSDKNDVILPSKEEVSSVSAASVGGGETPRNESRIEIRDDSEDSDEDDEDNRELEGRTVSAQGHQIDRASAANVKRTKEEISADPEKEDDFGYTMNKVKKKYANLGHSILMVQLERSSQGLGLSLAGHKDRNCMAVFVCGLNPTGAAYKAGGIEIGDEILEVNGVVLHGRCHLNASAIIKGLSGPIFKVIILRRKTAIDDIAVKPITQFPVSLAEEAGLEIGEMILAVNKDSLVGSTYDTAANLLKRTEGLVTLVVSNPGKKDDKNSVSSAPNSGLKPSKTTSRPTTPVPEPPVDIATCPINPGKDTTIEISTDNKGLGIFFVGGKDTLTPNGIILVEAYPGGTADKDGRLQPGDQILDVNGTPLKDVTHQAALQALRQTLPKMKMTIHRPATIEFNPIELDLAKKPGKGVGLSIKGRKGGKGAYVSDIVGGGAGDLDGRIAKGDLLVSVNGQNVENMSGEEVGAIIKTVTGRASLKINRYKAIAR
ncbi:unnamed protein product [Brassicogethes aeneus]|uniref:PDZ domain-containing protein n=1 Tax=Brassicogethes aeneus TaxID=1431903 RepID=A0A9P0AY46_BRAAE|nr:unnamed protein product [Brassicogethes aeneus]